MEFSKPKSIPNLLPENIFFIALIPYLIYSTIEYLAIVGSSFEGFRATIGNTPLILSILVGLYFLDTFNKNSNTEMVKYGLAIFTTEIIWRSASIFYLAYHNALIPEFLTGFIATGIFNNLILASLVISTGIIYNNFQTRFIKQGTSATILAATSILIIQEKIMLAPVTIIDIQGYLLNTATFTMLLTTALLAEIKQYTDYGKFRATSLILIASALLLYILEQFATTSSHYQIFLIPQDLITTIPIIATLAATSIILLIYDTISAFKHQMER